MRHRLLWCLATLPLVLLSGCSPAPDTPAGTPPAPAAEMLPDAPVPAAVMQLTATLSHDTCEAAAQLQTATLTFTAQPDADGFQAARKAWQNAHQQFRALKVLYKLAGLPMPHLGEDGRDTLTAHPLLPGYLDRVSGWPSSGLVHSDISLTQDFLRQDHQAFDFYNLTLGVHPIEFMLWGDGEAETQRLAAFLDTANAEPDRIPAEARRRQLLALMATTLVEDSALLCDPLMTDLLAQQLANLQQQGEQLGSRYQQLLEKVIQAPLAQLAAYPEGLDDQGMPVWRAAFARTDHEDLTDLQERLQGWQGILQLAPRENPAP
ncbi:MAG: hypothetical protein LAT63_14465 [Marinobacter sp.]|nr:hypothetical protein [Marinobacter sp.]